VRFTLTLFAAVTLFIGGCGTVPTANQAPSPSRAATVGTLGEGREGFFIHENNSLDSGSRRDFEQAVQLIHAQDYPPAIDLLEKVVQRSPGASAPYIDLAIAYNRTGKPDRAETHLKTALGLVPEHPVALNEYGLLCRKTGKFAEAKEHFQKAVRRFPEYYPARKNLGILCDLYLGDPSCALEHYEIYSAARPEDQQAKLWVVELRKRLGR
jgi:Tfp pilus assembly protein PilF